MDICLIALSGIFPIDIGGPGSVAYYLSKWLGRLDNNVTVYVRVKSKDKISIFKKNPHYFNLKNVNFEPITMEYKKENLMNIPKTILKINKLTNNYKFKNYDVIHYNSVPIDAALFLPTISKMKNIRQVISIHGGIFVMKKYLPGKMIINKQRNLFDKVIVHSDFSREAALNAGFSEDKLVSIPNGVDFEILNKSQPTHLSGDPKLLFVGRLTLNKGIHTIILALKLIIKDYPNLVFYIIGDGPFKPTLINIVKKLQLEQHVKFLGFLLTEKVYNYYKSVDLIIVPSYFENFSITLLEGMGSKVPIIASDATGNLNIIKNGINGLIFPKGDFKELSINIKYLIDNPSYAKKISEKAHDIAREKYDWEKIAKIHNRLYLSIIK